MDFVPSRGCMVVRLCLLGLILAGPLRAAAPPRYSTFSDTFDKEIRGRYHTQGAITWEKGKVLLQKNSTLARAIDVQSPVEFTAQLDLPALHEDKETSITELLLFLENGSRIRIDLRQQRLDGKVSGEVRLVHMTKTAQNKPISIILRQVALPDGPKSGEWNVSYRYGLIRVRQGKNAILVGYLSDPLGLIWAVGCGQAAGTATCRHLHLIGAEPARLSANQKKELLRSSAKLVESSRLAIAGEYGKAIPAAEQSLWLSEAAFGKRNVFTLNSLGSVGLVREQCLDPRARVYLDRAVILARDLYGKEHPETARWTAALGASLINAGDFEGGLRLFRQSLQVNERTLGTDSPTVAHQREFLGSHLLSVGDEQGAWSYLQTAFKAREAQGQEDRGLADLLCRMVPLLSARKEYTLARSHAERARKIYTRDAGPDSLEMAGLLRIEAQLELSQGNKPAARALLHKAWKILGEFPNRDRQRADGLVLLGSAFEQQGDVARVKMCYEKARTLYERVFGEVHPGVSRCLALLGSLELQLSRPVEARKFFEKALAIQHKLASSVLPGLSETEALEYLVQGLDQRDVLLYTLGRIPATPAEDAYRVVWKTRALVSRTLLSRIPLWLKNPRANEVQENLRLVRGRLARIVMVERPPGEAVARQKKLEELTQKKEELERELASHSDLFDRNRRALQVDFPALAGLLPLDTAVVEVVRREHHGQFPAYEAFVLRKITGQPGYRLKWIRLGRAEPIDLAVRRLRGQFQGRGSLVRIEPPKKNARPPEAEIRRLVWEKFEPALLGCKKVIVIPDGPLTRVPWAALPGKKKGTFLIEDYALGTASYGHQLYELATRRLPKGNTLLVVGGVRYDSPAASPPSDSSLARPAVVGATYRPDWPFLPGTAAELDSLAAMWKGKGKVVSLRGSRASKSAVLEALSEARFIHLATHGFFSEGKYLSLSHRDRGPAQPPPGAFAFGRRAGLAARNPMLLSGLVLAGANVASVERLSGAPAGDNGILTAEELAGQDCGGAELVVLSACETGLGDVIGGEGVFGLQRAFALGGARSVVASLWKVPDRGTQVLMERFYDNLWRKKMSRLEALQQAQIWMLRQGPKHRERLRGLDFTDEDFLPPSYWAGFVLCGGWD